MPTLTGHHAPRFVAAGDLMRLPYLVMEYVSPDARHRWRGNGQGLRWYGQNFINPALAGRAFLCCLSVQISGDAVWTVVDGVGNAAGNGSSGRRVIGVAGGQLGDAFFGFLPGSGTVRPATLLILIVGAVLLSPSPRELWRGSSRE